MPGTKTVDKLRSQVEQGGVVSESERVWLAGALSGSISKGIGD